MEFKLKGQLLSARTEFEMIKITPEVRAFVEESGIENGLVYVITGLTPQASRLMKAWTVWKKSIMECLSRIAPEDYPYHH